MTNREDLPTIQRRTGEIVREERITLTQLARECGCEVTVVEKFVLHGILEPVGQTSETLVFPDRIAGRLGKALRLQKDFELNLEGLGLVLDLLDRIEDLEERIRRMERL